MVGRSQARPRFFRQPPPGSCDSGKHVRRVYRHLLVQPRLSRAGCAGGMRARSGSRSKDRLAGRRACAGRRHHCVARRQRFPRIIAGRSGHARRDRRRCRVHHGCRRIPARSAQRCGGGPAQGSCQRSPIISGTGNHLQAYSSKDKAPVVSGAFSAATKGSVGHLQPLWGFAFTQTKLLFWGCRPDLPVTRFRGYE